MATSPPESKRIRKFRDAIIAAVPRFNNNDKASKTQLAQQSLGGLLVVFLNWRMRFVSQAPRTVSIRRTASSDRRRRSLKPAIDSFLDKVRRGDDLTPHLSLGAWREGYTPAAQAQGAAADRWADKDFVLNVMGFHHFHLGQTVEREGFVTRTDDVLFAYVTRTAFDVIGLFDHSVFDDEDPAAMTAERARLWRLHAQFLAELLGPGTFIAANPVSLSGHTTQIVLLAQSYAKLIRNIDPRLDDRAFLAANLYTAAGVPVPDKPKLRWAFRHLDLHLADDAIQASFLMRRGPV